jgi:hypothetical protein
MMGMKTHLIALVLCLGACGKLGSDCDYASTAGTCRITKLATQSASPETTFDFIVDGQTADTGVLVSGSTNPTEACLAANNVTVGSSFACTLQTMTKGTCSPKVFDVPGFNANASGCQ